ncbi:hypothetical protein KJ855_04690 [Patescibacteria group bacterium]|nr:hypothetical protein [Patescibacteria group bacterium]
MDWIKYYHLQELNVDQEIAKKAEVMKDELGKVLYDWQTGFGQTPVRVAVLGCGDIRMMDWHRKIFGELLGQNIKIFTFDIDIDHLEGEENVLKHDCREPLPKAPFDIVYSHVLLKFLRPEDQWKVIWNSYEAIKPQGRAIHVLDKDDYTDTGEVGDKDNYLVLLDEWLERLYDSKIKYDEVDIDHGLALVIYKNVD